MKIPKTIREIYEENYEVYDRLKNAIDVIFKEIKRDNWHYTSRLKSKESFCLKVETGRCSGLHLLEDYFACTLVVENLASISDAEKLVKGKFVIHERRPRDASVTNKTSDSFKFDDIRLYVTWKDDPDLPPSEFKGVLFEVQIKTFLAHAWAIATHDLIYKTDQISWPKERIAYQIKAMLEHAEISIMEAQKLSKAKLMKKSFNKYENISKIINLLNELWPSVNLPTDRKRLAENIQHLIDAVGIDVERLKYLVNKETSLGRGIKTLNLSPYLIIVQALLNHEEKKVHKFLTKGKTRFKLIITDELELPASIKGVTLKNALIGPDFLE